jgi:transposase
LPLGRWQGVKLLHERVAGIDVHKDMTAIRSPGQKPWTRKTEVFEFRTFYGVLQEVVRQLRHRGVTHVAMEASGAYTDPVYYALTELDFTEVIVASPAHVKALKGHKTDPPKTARGWRSCWGAGCCTARSSRPRSKGRCGT